MNNRTPTSWSRPTVAHDSPKEAPMKFISYGPVANDDGSPTQTTIDMLEGTGRSPEEFARESSGVLAGHIADGRGHNTDMTCCDPAYAAYDAVMNDEYGPVWPSGVDLRGADRERLTDTIMRATAAYDEAKRAAKPVCEVCGSDEPEAMHNVLGHKVLTRAEQDALTRQALDDEPEYDTEVTL